MAKDSEDAEGLNKFYAPSREPATLYVNNFYVTGSSEIIRIAFGESAAGPVGTKYRVAVAMPLEDAKELARILQRMTDDIENEKETKAF
jgi:hypothetical protein